MIYINLAYEDDLSEVVMTKLLESFGNKYAIHNTYPGHGFGYLKTNIRGFNQASVVAPFFMLTDLDNYDCPPSLMKDWITFPLQPNFIFRIAIKEVEAWLLADREGLSDFMKVPLVNFPSAPEKELDPKRTLIQLAKRSRSRRIREDIVPINENAQIGPNYNGSLMEFVIEKWNIENATTRSRSLEKAVSKLATFNN
ncbi:hypothetical protein MASR2M47_43010 [Draconibacterium sp.]